MAEYKQSDQKWQAYYKMVSARPVRSFFHDAVKLFKAPGTAVDLGCGAGIETLYLLRQGWRVLAVDQQPSALEFIQSGLPEYLRAGLEVRLASFESLEIPESDFIWAGLSLPFCPSHHFESLWPRIVAAIRPGGRFAGDFFGERHAWFRTKTMNFQTREQVLALCKPLHLEYFREEEGEEVTAADGIQHWHMFSVRVLKG